LLHHLDHFAELYVVVNPARMELTRIPWYGGRVFGLQEAIPVADRRAKGQSALGNAPYQFIAHRRSNMDTLEAIRTRRSVRKYQDRPVSEELVRTLLEAAMSAPSARNGRPWQFVLIDDRKMLSEVARINPNAQMASRAPLAILVCGDLREEKSPGYWVVDCAAATENILLAAHALGLGAVWTGVYPREERIEGLRRLVELPNEITPHSLVVLGYPAERPAPQERYQPERVHRNRWQ
jgi:nitroreductase